jgi:hypothetical protein
VQRCQNGNYQGTGCRGKACLSGLPQPVNRQFHNPGYQQCKSIGHEKKTAAGGVAPAKRNQVAIQEREIFYGGVSLLC